MCGSFASKDEAILLKKVDPVLFNLIQWITHGIKNFGSPTAKKNSKWGQTSDFDDIENQKILETFFTKDQLKDMDKMEVLSCGSECGASTMKGTLDF